MRIRNHELEMFIDFILSKPSYTRSESRMRNRLIEILQSKFQSFKNDHLELLKQFAEVKENGEFVLIPVDVVNDKYKYSFADQVGFENEYMLLANEEFIIDQTESNKSMLLTIKECVLTYDPKLKGIESNIRDRCHDIVEEINYPETQPIVGD